jgi:hypothetical protein
VTPKPPKALTVGVPAVDAFVLNPKPTMQDYVAASSAYVLASPGLADGPKKAAQIRLSSGLGRILKADLAPKLPPTADLFAGEREVSGALRSVNADLSELHELDGLRLAVEMKPVNLAVGRAIWNRFGDIRTFAVNLHLKFPFSVVGGVLVIPTWEWDGAKQKSTKHLIDRAIKRLERAGGRKTEGDAPHLLEGIGLVTYDPSTATQDPTLPSPTSPLSWPLFVDGLANAYLARFE